MGVSDEEVAAFSADKADVDLVRRLVGEADSGGAWSVACCVCCACEEKGVEESHASPTDERELREEEKRGRGGSGAGVKVSGLGMEGVREVSSEAISISVVSSISPSVGMSFAPARGILLLSSSFSLSSLSASRAMMVA